MIIFAIIFSAFWNVLALTLIEGGEFWVSSAGFFMIALWFMFALGYHIEEVADKVVNRILDESSTGLDSWSQRRASLRASDEKYYAETLANKDGTNDKSHQ